MAPAMLTLNRSHQSDIQKLRVRVQRLLSTYIYLSCILYLPASLLFWMHVARDLSISPKFQASRQLSERLSSMWRFRRKFPGHLRCSRRLNGPDADTRGQCAPMRAWTTFILLVVLLREATQWARRDGTPRISGRICYVKVKMREKERRRKRKKYERSTTQQRSSDARNKCGRKYHNCTTSYFYNHFSHDDGVR